MAEHKHQQELHDKINGNVLYIQKELSQIKQKFAELTKANDNVAEKTNKQEEELKNLRNEIACLKKELKDIKTHFVQDLADLKLHLSTNYLPQLECKEKSEKFIRLIDKLDEKTDEIEKDALEREKLVRKDTIKYIITLLFVLLSVLGLVFGGQIYFG